MREEDNIEKEGLQEDNPDIGDNSGDEDFAECRNVLNSENGYRYRIHRSSSVGKNKCWKI